MSSPTSPLDSTEDLELQRLRKQEHEHTDDDLHRSNNNIHLNGNGVVRHSYDDDDADSFIDEDGDRALLSPHVRPRSRERDSADAASVWHSIKSVVYEASCPTPMIHPDTDLVC